MNLDSGIYFEYVGVVSQNAALAYGSDGRGNGKDLPGGNPPPPPAYRPTPRYYIVTW
ncbi:hypothetical protein BRE01_50750 [Brevibacillus reuszeri]|uniref:Uncharacterized protein n=1 Tax=Brevibacillus reuszeri TaxID=54915 RepID=A0ABQ0TWM9_9BACL|nr:hypothetical protein BRE01_50750 [Brevibacillus reuszeri]